MKKVIFFLSLFIFLYSQQNEEIIKKKSKEKINNKYNNKYKFKDEPRLYIETRNGVGFLLPERNHAFAFASENNISYLLLDMQNFYHFIQFGYSFITFATTIKGGYQSFEMNDQLQIQNEKSIDETIIDSFQFIHFKYLLQNQISSLFFLQGSLAFYVLINKNTVYQQININRNISIFEDNFIFYFSPSIGGNFNLFKLFNNQTNKKWLQGDLGLTYKFFLVDLSGDVSVSLEHLLILDFSLKYFF